jgi:excisionase family DNA binding protein
MPRAKGKRRQPANDAPAASAEVLTLAEAASYLRVPEEELRQMLGQADFPARQVGREWRFSRAALQEWLRTPPTSPSKAAVLQRIGSWKDDPYLEEMLEGIYERRGRLMTEVGE